MIIIILTLMKIIQKTQAKNIYMLQYLFSEQLEKIIDQYKLQGYF